MRRAAATALFLAALAAAPRPAHADAIDGDWCSAEGLKLSITGSSIRLPSGREIQGQYRRHEFAYEAPPGDENEGDIAYLQQQSEELMLFLWIRNGQPGEPESWRRCNVTS